MFPNNNQNTLGFGHFSRQGNQNPQPNQSTGPTPTVPIPQMYDPQMAAYMALLQNSMPNAVPGFQNPMTNIFKVSGSQPAPETQPEVEFVPETQPVPDTVGGSSKPKRSHKKKPPGEARAKKTVISWTTEESYICARAWCNISEDAKCGRFLKHIYIFKISYNKH